MCIDKDEMNKIFDSLDKESTVGIFIHPAPDPDCMGAAAGFALLLKEVYGLASKIYHFGEISHPQNKSMKNILHINLEDGNDFNPEDVSATVVLDTDLHNSGFKSDKLESVDVRIDHHVSLDRDEPPKLKDIRACGSTCAIVWDYLREFEVSLEHHVEEATSLVIGIKTDTLDFTRSTTDELDMEAFRLLLPFVDKAALARVTQFPLPKIIFETETKAFKNKEIRNTTLISFIGETTAHNRDVIPSIADRFARMDGVSTSIVLGIIDDAMVASIRSSDGRVDVADLCTSVFGKTNGGGKEGAAAARMPLGVAYELIQDKDAKELMIKEIVAGLRSKIFLTLGEHEEEK